MVSNRVEWPARILTILFAGFISIFALDVFSEGLDFWNTIPALLLHLTPAFIILFILWLSWNRSWPGAIFFPLLGLVYLITAWGKFHWTAYAVISGPLFLLGVLYFISWITKR